MGKEIVEMEINEEVLRRIDEILKFSNVISQVRERDLPKSRNDIINAALYYYLQKIDIWLSFHRFEINSLSMDDKSKLKNNIKEISKCIGIKQKDISRLTGIDEASISTIFSNRNQPSMENFLRLWSLLGNPPIEEMFYREKI